MWVRVSNLHFPDKMKSRRHKEWWLKVFPSHVGASFQLAHPRQDEIVSPQLQKPGSLTVEKVIHAQRAMQPASTWKTSVLS